MRKNSSLCIALLGTVVAFMPAGAGAEVGTESTRPVSRYFKHAVYAQWKPDSAIVSNISPTATSAAWWRSFDDTMLDSLINIGRENNYNVAMAARRIAIAQAGVQQAASAYYPQVGIDAGWTRTRDSGRLTGSEGRASTGSYFSAGATMSWEVDVFGKISRQVNKAKTSVKVTKAEFDGVMVSLDAQIASTYIDLVVSRAQLVVARNHTASQQHIVDITETRRRTGLASKLDVAQANALYYTTRASIPMLEAQIEADYNALSVLLGVTRAELPQSIYNHRPIPEHTHLLDLGVPADMLRRRPDVVEAERNIDVAAAELGIARAEYLPSLTLEASAGTGAHRLGDLFSGPSFTYAITPTLSWTIFDGLSRRAATAQARENMEVQIDNYNLTVLTAMEEVRNAMSRYSATLRYLNDMEEVLVSSQEAVRLSLDQYKEGLTDFYNVVQAQLSNLENQNNYIAGRGNALSALVSLYKALGGAYYEQ